MPDFLGAFYFYTQEALQTRDGHDACIETCEVGALVLTSGKIVACDGLIPSDEPFTHAVAPGSYPVTLSLLHVGDERSRVACVMLRMKDEMPTAWKPAVVASRDQCAGYGVDTGVGCFADLDTIRTLMTAPETYERLKKTVNKWGVDWGDFRINDSTDANIITFSSGEGDGIYPSYFGYDDGDDVLCLATDFGILAPLPEKQTEKPHKDQLRLDF